MRGAGRPKAAGGWRRWAAAVVTVALVAWIATGVDGGAYQVAWRARPAGVGAQPAEQARRRGDAAGALALLESAPVEVPAVVLTRALALADIGRLDEATAALERLRQDARAAAVLGDLALRGGDLPAARRLWGQRELDLANPLDWAWERVNRPAHRAEIGDGLDLGLVRGFHLDEREGETRFRWSDGTGSVRLRVAAAGEYRLRARLRGYRPAGRPPPPVGVVIDSAPVATWALGGDWEVRTVNVHIDEPGVVVHLDSPTFVPGYHDQRSLGVMVDWVELEAAG